MAASERTAAAHLEAYGDVVAAVESGAGLPEAARATSRALDASVAIIDTAASVLAVACASPADERAVLEQARGTQTLELMVAATVVGELRYRPRGEPPPPTLLRMVGTLLGFEVERSRGPERASRAAVGVFIADLLERRATDRENILARANELGCDLAAGAAVVAARVHPQRPEEGDWRARVLAVVERGARGAARSALVSDSGATEGDAIVIVPGAEDARRTAEAVLRELRASLGTAYSYVVAFSRVAADPADVHRAGAEATLAANVAAAQGTPLLAFDETGAYRLLLPAMSEDPAELRRFHDETIAPIVAYDEQYDTELVRTLESFLDADGNVARTAERLYTHRHTIRYRLERVRDLTGLDVASTDGRERLGLGLKAMRVLGISPPQGPGAERNER